MNTLPVNTNFSTYYLCTQIDKTLNLFKNLHRLKLSLYHMPVPYFINSHATWSLQHVRTYLANTIDHGEVIREDQAPSSTSSMPKDMNCTVQAVFTKINTVIRVKK